MSAIERDYAGLVAAGDLEEVKRILRALADAVDPSGALGPA